MPDPISTSTSDEHEYLTPKELAAEWRVSAHTIRRHCREGRIKAHRFGGQWRIRRKSVRPHQKAASAA